jgi:hypothetical protein
MYALSVRQPWPCAMEFFGKDIENRSRKTNIRGRILVHASRHKPTEDDKDDLKVMMMRAVRAGTLTTAMLERFCGGRPSAVALAIHMETGGFVGSVEIVDCVQIHSSPWKLDGTWGYVLRDYRPLMKGFMPAIGQRGFWQVPGGEALAA